MSQTINCPSCGAANQLPEGKNSMFCAFCGSAIQKIELEKKLDSVSSIKMKPEISQRKTINQSVPKYDQYSPDLIKYVTEETVVQFGGELSLINRNIKSLEEITSLFSDNELNEIRSLTLSKNKIKYINEIERFSSLNYLNLSYNELELLDKNLNLYTKVNLDYLYISNNKIRSVKGISTFTVNKQIDLSNNYLSVLDDFPVNCAWGIKVDLSNNYDLTNFSDSAIGNILKSSIENNSQRVEFELFGCDKFNFQTFNKIIEKNKEFHIWLYLEPNIKNSNELVSLGFQKMENYCDGKKWTWKYPKLNDISNKNSNQNNNKCFIATATMGSYNHPTVMELRYFRDNWILKKWWGESFVEWYYHYGSIAAKSIEKSFVLKKISYLLIVKPLYVLSKLINKK